MRKWKQSLRQNQKASTKKSQYLGLIRPKVTKRTRNKQREQRLVFRLNRGQKFYLRTNIYGGNKDIDCYITNFRNGGISKEKVIRRKDIEFVPKSTGNYSFVLAMLFMADRERCGSCLLSGNWPRAKNRNRIVE